MTSLHSNLDTEEPTLRTREAVLTTSRGSSAAGSVNGTKIAFMPGFPSTSFIASPAAGTQLVADRLAEGVDYIKLFLDPLGPDDATINAVISLCSI